MSKSILVIEMPKNCGECILANEDYDCCQATQKSISYDERGYGIECPLKPMPEKMGNRLVVNDEEITSAYQSGFNDCIDEILGEEE